MQPEPKRSGCTLLFKREGQAIACSDLPGLEPMIPFFRNRRPQASPSPPFPASGPATPASHQHRNQPQDEAFAFIGPSSVPGGGTLFASTPDSGSIFCFLFLCPCSAADQRAALRRRRPEVQFLPGTKFLARTAAALPPSRCVFPQRIPFKVRPGVHNEPANGEKFFRRWCRKPAFGAVTPAGWVQVPRS